MARLNLDCPTCGNATIIGDWTFGPVTTIAFKCGHTLIEHMTDAMQATQRSERLASEVQFDKLMPFQKIGVHFMEDQLANHGKIRLILADEPGLGKTVQAIATVDRNFKLLTPCLIVCPPSLTIHWMRFLQSWLSPENKNNLILWHSMRNLPLVPGAAIMVIGNNLISDPRTFESITNYGFRFAIIDECHHFNNDTAARTATLIRLFAKSYLDKRGHVIRNPAPINSSLFLSGTPLVNRVMDYFTTLHICDPAQWYDKGQLANICMRDDKNRPLSISSANRPWFFNRIGKYFLRRKKLDVLTELPPFTRDFESGFIAADNPNTVKMYNAILDKLADAIDQVDSASVLGLIAQLRRIIGESKGYAVAERVYEELRSDESDTSKIAIGVHHYATGDLITARLAELAKADSYSLPLLHMNGSHDAHKKQLIEESFRLPQNRVLIANTLACCEGRNMQFCSRAYLAEREWNPAKEEQFEQRFWRKGQENPVDVTYIQVEKTIDEWFHEAVELKRLITASGQDSDVSIDPDLVMNIARKAVGHRMRAVGV